MLSLGALPVGVDYGSRVLVHVHVHACVRVRVLSFRGVGRGRDLPREDQGSKDHGSRIMD